jgi:hypothetical protein
MGIRFIGSRWRPVRRTEDNESGGDSCPRLFSRAKPDALAAQERSTDGSRGRRPAAVIQNIDYFVYFI